MPRSANHSGRKAVLTAAAANSAAKNSAMRVPGDGVPGDVAVALKRMAIMLSVLLLGRSSRHDGDPQVSIDVRGPQLTGGIPRGHRPACRGDVVIDLVRDEIRIRSLHAVVARAQALSHHLLGDGPDVSVQ